MNHPNYFDQSASTWDSEPRRIALMKAVGESILREVKPTPTMDVLDYGCGTGLISLFVLPHVRSVTGADSSAGMLDVLNSKIQEGNLPDMKTLALNLEQEPIPNDRYHLIVSSMVMHHIADLDRVLTAFSQMLLPGGLLCIADLDTEPGIFHQPDAADSVHHHRFDRVASMNSLEKAGFSNIKATTAQFVTKPVQDGRLIEFPIFLIVGRR